MTDPLIDRYQQFNSSLTDLDNSVRDMRRSLYTSIAGKPEAQPQQADQPNPIEVGTSAFKRALSDINTGLTLHGMSNPTDDADTFVKLAEEEYTKLKQQPVVDTSQQGYIRKAANWISDLVGSVAPTIAGTVATSTALVETGPGALVGGAGAATLIQSAQSFGGSFNNNYFKARESGASPTEAYKQAYDVAIKDSGIAAVATVASAGFPLLRQTLGKAITPTASGEMIGKIASESARERLLPATAKVLTGQGLSTAAKVGIATAEQTAIGVGQQAASNVVNDRPITEGLGEAALAQVLIGTPFEVMAARGQTARENQSNVPDNRTSTDQAIQSDTQPIQTESQSTQSDLDFLVQDDTAPVQDSSQNQPLSRDGEQAVSSETAPLVDESLFANLDTLRVVDEATPILEQSVSPTEPIATKDTAPIAGETPAVEQAGLDFETKAINDGFTPLYRATDKGETGLRPWSSWTPEMETAQAYQDNPGYGGEFIRKIYAKPDRVLEVDGYSRASFKRLAEDIGLDKQNGEDWFDSGWRYPWEESRKIKEKIAEKYDWLKYKDDFPEGATTIVATNEKALSQILEGPSKSSTISEALTKAAEIVEKGRISTTGKIYDATLGIPIAVWNSAIDTIKVALKAGASIAEAVEKAIGYIRSSLPKEVTFDENQYRDKVMKVLVPEPGVMKQDGSVNKFAQRVADDTRIADQTRAEVKTKTLPGGRYSYKPLSNASSNAEALTFLDEAGIDAAIAEVTSEKSAVSPAVKTFLAQNTILRLNDQLASAFEAKDKTFAEQVALKQERLLDATVKAGMEQGRGIQAFAAWSRLSPEGFLLSYKRQIDTIADELKKRGVNPNKIPKFDPTTANEIRRRVKDAQKLPEGFQRDRAMVDAMDFMHNQLPTKKSDILLSWWYASILSGPGTQAVNLFSTAANVLLETSVTIANNPKSTPYALMGLYQGLLKGVPDAKAALAGDQTSKRVVDKLRVSNVLERRAFPGGKFNPVNYGKFVFRIMQSADILNFSASKEMRAYTLALRELESKYQGIELSRKISERLHNTDEIRVEAEAIAKGEGLKGNDFKRRVNEIIEQRRPAALMEEAVDFALRATYNQKPEGPLGVLAETLSKYSSQYPAAKFIIPFTNIIGNVFNTSLDYSPWGYARLYFGKASGKFEPKSEAYYRQLTKATMGSLGMITVAALAAKHLEDEDPYFMISGTGPRDPRIKNQLRKSGWKERTIKIGDQYFIYTTTPFAVPFSIIGNYMDSKRYEKIDDQELGNRLFAATTGVGRSLLDQSFLTGLSDFFDAFNSKGSTDGKSIQRLLSKIGTSFAVPNAVKYVDRVFNPQVGNASSFSEYLVRETPVARQSLKPLISVLGEPVEYNQSRFFTSMTADPVWKLIADKQAWISTPSKSTTLGDRTLTPDEYYRLIEISGPRIKERIKQLLPKLKKMESEQVDEIVDKIAKEERAIAKNILRREAINKGTLK